MSALALAKSPNPHTPAAYVEVQVDFARLLPADNEARAEWIATHGGVPANATVRCPADLTTLAKAGATIHADGSATLDTTTRETTPAAILSTRLVRAAERHFEHHGKVPAELAATEVRRACWEAAAIAEWETDVRTKARRGSQARRKSTTSSSVTPNSPSWDADRLIRADFLLYGDHYSLDELATRAQRVSYREMFRRYITHSGWDHERNCDRLTVRDAELRAAIADLLDELILSGHITKRTVRVDGTPVDVYRCTAKDL